jgi:hypothetical protein
LHGIQNYSSALIYYLEAMTMKATFQTYIFTVSAAKVSAPCQSAKCHEKLQEQQFYIYFCCSDKERHYNKVARALCPLRLEAN